MVPESKPQPAITSVVIVDWDDTIAVRKERHDVPEIDVEIRSLIRREAKRPDTVVVLLTSNTDEGLADQLRRNSSLTASFSYILTRDSTYTVANKIGGFADALAGVAKDHGEGSYRVASISDGTGDTRDAAALGIHAIGVSRAEIYGQWPAGSHRDHGAAAVATTVHELESALRAWHDSPATLELVANPESPVRNHDLSAIIEIAVWDSQAVHEPLRRAHDGISTALVTDGFEPQQM